MTETKPEVDTIEVPRDHYEHLVNIAEQVEPVCDDLMSEVAGSGVVEDWGAVNRLLINAERAVANAEQLGVA